MPRASIVLLENSVTLQQAGAGFAELVVDLRGYVENESSGNLNAIIMYEFSTNGQPDASGVLTWSEGSSLEPGARREFRVSGARHAVIRQPNSLKIYFVGPVLTAPSLELYERCPAQMPPVNDSFGTFTTAVTFR